jgi:hypothetical protein
VLLGASFLVVVALSRRGAPTAAKAE